MNAAFIGGQPSRRSNAETYTMYRLAMGVAALAVMAMPAKATLLGNDLQDWNTSSAATLTVTPTAPGQQVTNLPCLICGATQPQQPTGFGYNLFGNQGNLNVLPYFSTSVVGGSLGPDQFGGLTTGYTIDANSPFLTALKGNLTFSVGVDSNQAGTDSQVLESFWFLNFTTHTVLAVFSPGPGGYNIDPLNNGTGFPDYTINGFSLLGINSGDRIGFFARITNANDGPDSFFLLPQALAETPVPGAVWLFGSVIAGAGALRTLRNRKRRVA
jgi:hypothetical protein